MFQLSIISVLNAAHLKEHILVAARIDGSQQVPSISSSARGVAGLVFNAMRDSMCVSVSFTGLTGPLTGAHIHEGLPGVNGNILIDLTSGINGNLISSTVTGLNLPLSLISKILAGECYINLHTAANPNGEIRGQLLLEADKSFQVTLNGLQEVPSVITNAYGTGYFNLSKDASKIKYLIVMQGLSAPLTGAHLHLGQPGISGPITIDLTSSISGNTISGVISNPTVDLMDSLNAGSIYLNVHNSIFPSGEIRGQLINEQRYLYFDAIVNGAQEVPAVITSATGIAAVKLNTTFDSLWVEAVADGLSGPIMGAHFHNGNPGISGPIELDLTSFINGNKIMGVITGSALTTTLINKFIRGEIYINMHTTNQPAGEIRGQIYRLIREGYTVFMNGNQEVPAVNSIATGTGIVSIDRDQDNAHFMIVASNITPTGAHFHNAIAGQSGGVIYDLFPFYSNDAMYGYWKSTDSIPFTVAQSVRFRNDSVYVNLHTVANPGGEIRGQVKRGFICQDFTTGIQFAATSGNASILIYPNPAINQLQIKMNFAKTGEKQILLYSALGQQLYNRNISVTDNESTNTIDISKLKSGLYKLMVVDEDGNIVTETFQKHTF